MIVMVTMVLVKIAKVIFLCFCSDGNSSNGKVNKRSTICGKLVGIGSVMDNYIGCDT